MSKIFIVVGSLCGDENCFDHNVCAFTSLDLAEQKRKELNNKVEELCAECVSNFGMRTVINHGQVEERMHELDPQYCSSTFSSTIYTVEELDLIA